MNQLFTLLDREHKKAMSPQSIQQHRQRIRSDTPSSRPKPEGDYPTWIFDEHAT